MPYKQLLFRSAAREKILHGASALADAVRVGGSARPGLATRSPLEPNTSAGRRYPGTRKVEESTECVLPR
jgi:hypothetical protein